MKKTVIKIAELTSGMMMTAMALGAAVSLKTGNLAAFASTAILFVLLGVLLVRNIITDKKGGSAASWS